MEPCLNPSSTPLISLEAIAVDTETTGLDARTAWVCEVAAVRIRGLQLDTPAALDTLVDPGVAMPPAAARVHGLGAEQLAKAPAFAAIAADLDRAIGSAVVVGHNVGYDLAVLDREYARAGIGWKLPRFLDVRALARLAAPDLASYALEALCDWQQVPMVQRHRALPDAEAAGRLFIRLIPLLRARGVRTLAEAERACRNLAGEERMYHMNSWVSPASAPQSHPAAALAASDSYPFRHRVRELELRPALFVPPGADPREMASALAQRPDARFLIVGSADDVRGVVSARDLLSAVLETEPRSPNLSITPLATADENDFLYRALGRLQRLGAEHIAVLDRRGHVTGTLSAGDLLRHRVSSALVLGDGIEEAAGVSELGRLWSRVPAVVETLLAEAIEAPRIAAIVSSEIRALTAKVARLAEQRMLELGRGAPPCAYAVLVLGSAGRGDSLLSADQDNAIIHACGDPGGAEDVWFAELGTLIADLLNEIGIPYCPGGVMAKNPGCRHSAPIWRRVVSDWTGRAHMADLLAADIFFDGVAVHGDTALADEVFDFAFARATASPGFIMALAAFAKDWYPPIGMLGRLAVDGDGRLDLKRNGLLPVVTAARTFALRYDIRPTSTLARLEEIKSRGLADGAVIEAAMRAYGVMVRLILAQQVRDGHEGIPPSARVEVATMTAASRKLLKESMQAISALVGCTLNL